MGYDIYRKKQFIEVEGQRIMPLAMYSDSNIYDEYGKRPSYWCLYDISRGGGLLASKKEFEAARKEMIDFELAKLRDYHKRYEPDEAEPNMESWCYSGDRFPGGGRLKHMRAFFSTRKTVSPEEFFRQYGTFWVHASWNDKKSYSRVDWEEYKISCEYDIIEADWKLRDFRSRMPKDCVMSIDISGLWV